MTFQVANYKGRVISGCGNKHFFISSKNTKTDGNTIWSKCCEIGASPATFATRAEFECLAKRYWEMPDDFKELRGYHPYYIGARDMNLTRNFQFCPDHRLIPDELWMGHVSENPYFVRQIEPNNDNGMERCVCGVLIPGYVGLMDTDGNTIWSKCCEIGASPATFATRAEFDCLAKRYWEMPDNFKESSGYHPYYIGARDMNVTRNFQFCPDHRLIPDELWMGHISQDSIWARQIEPNNENGMERCVGGVFIPGYVGLMDVNCISTNKYICQVNII
ncbi:hypothetical protein B566_EDAN016727 [Ephemera danica]|nr:hypothetical protein B566_EDAN016727 [Ephemera danica]